MPSSRIAVSAIGETDNVLVSLVLCLCVLFLCCVVADLVLGATVEDAFGYGSAFGFCRWLWEAVVAIKAVFVLLLFLFCSVLVCFIWLNNEKTCAKTARDEPNPPQQCTTTIYQLIL